MASGTSSPFGGALAGGSAPVSVEPAAAGGHVASNVTFEWDFDNDGDFDESVEDITDLVLAAQTSMGRDFPSNLTGRSGPGKMKLTLRNDDDRFSYFNTSSPLNTAPFSTKTGRKVRVRVNDAVTGAADISYVGIGAAAIGNNASVTPAFPTGLRSAETSEDGNADLLCILASIRNSGTGTVDQPSGWARMAVTGNVAVLARYYEEGLEAPTVTFSGGVANATTSAQCFAFRGVHQELVRAFVNVQTQSNASAANIAVPGAVASAQTWLDDPDDVATVVCGWRQDDVTSIATLAGQFMTEISDTPSTTGDDIHLAIQYRLGGFANAKTFSATNLVVTGGANAVSRAIVFQLAPAVAIAEPVLLAYDDFVRPDSNALGTSASGHVWTTRAGGGFGIVSGRAEAPRELLAQYNTSIISTLDTGTTDHYVQAKMPIRVQDGRVGLVARYLDASNYVRLFYDVEIKRVVVQEVVAGVATNLPNGSDDGFQIEGWDGMTLGLLVRNTEAFALVGGQIVDFGHLYLSQTAAVGATHAGIYGLHQQHSDVAPMSRSFRVYDKVHGPLDGIIWTGWVKSVSPSVQAGPYKVVEVEAEGPLAGAAAVTIAAPRIVRSVGEIDGSLNNHSVPAGCIVGDCMARAGLLEPPYPLEQYPLSRLGPIAIPDGKALELARLIELNERGPGAGFIKETPEGAITFEDRYYRQGSSSRAWFSDTPGAGQFGIEAIEPLDHEGQVINRALAQVAASSPTVVDVSNQSDSASDLDVSIIVPDVEYGDLVLVYVACSAVQAGRQWSEPIGWTLHRDAGDEEGIRVYSLISDGTEAGQQVYFLKTEAEGTFIAHIYVIRDWYGTDDGIKLGRVSSGAFGGTDAYPISPGWNRAPALYILFQGVIGANSGILWDDLNTPPPLGYDYNTLEGLVFVYSPEAYETGVESVYKLDVTDQENPRAWNDVFTDYLLLESVVVAIRGYNGPIEKTTIDDDEAVNGAADGLVVQVDDVESQADHRFIRTNPDVPTLLYTEAAARAWCQAVIDEHAEDRPIVTISFTASKSAALRDQAIRRRVSDRVTVTASGNSGLGIEQDFHIENVHHAWQKGTTLWVTTYELSPA